MTDPSGTDQDLEQEELGRLYETVRRELFRGRIDAADEAARRLLEKTPDSTSAHELMGDVLSARGQRARARDEYKQAMTLEPANADAERKFAEAMLLMGEAERTRNLVASGDFASLRRTGPGDAGAAAVRSMFFPGLGQLYNGDYEKGVIVCLVSLPLFGLALWGITGFVTVAIPSLANKLEQPMSVGQTILALIGLFGYGGMVAWSAWDAYTAARRQS